MTTQVNLLAHDSLSIALMNAMAAIPGGEGTYLVFPEMRDPSYRRPAAETADCELKVLLNGVEVPFAQELRKSIDAITSRINEHIKNEALERIQKHPLLGELHRLMDDAEWQIREAIEGLYKE